MQAFNDRMSDLERDALRYRWLRDTQNTALRGDCDNEPVGTVGNIFVCVGEGIAESPLSDELDSAIDAAMLAAGARCNGGL